METVIGFVSIFKEHLAK